MNVFLEKEIARNYDEYYKTKFGKKVDEAEKKIINSLIENITPGNILDIGCGTGHWSVFLSEKGFGVTGIDISDAMLDLAKNKYPGMNFLKGNSQNLPFNNNSFDAVLSVTMLEFVDNIEKAVDEMYRVLKNSGYIIVGCLNKNSVIGKNKSNDPVFKNAVFLSTDMLHKVFHQFEITEIKTGVHLNDDYSFSDITENTEPAFIGIKAKKI